MSMNRKSKRRGAGRASGFAVMGALCLGAAYPLGAADLELPPELTTYADGRLPVEALYRAYLSLQEKGWQLDVVTQSMPPGRSHALPVIALRTPATGPAIWIISGIHGEEPAGPNAIATAIDDIAALGTRHAVVLLPLNNPQGYVHNWRYLNMAVYSAEADGQSVGDSSHLLPDPEHPEKPRSASASSPEADAITRYVLNWSASYPPFVSIDLHEDNLISEGYVYSQGQLGADDPLARAAIGVLQQNGIPIRLSGQTRFGETIKDGIVGPVVDGSIDELVGASTISLNGQVLPGPSARTVLVFETPAREVDLQQRMAAHAAFLKKLEWEISQTAPR